jgi:adenylosuccinate synthase
LLGLGFGDCGKGLFTDYLTRRLNAHSVVRFNGGAQAGHNVVLPDGRHHTFSQFGAGSFVDGVCTVLSSPVVVHPSALLFETQALERTGVRNALQRIMIDARCRVTTPFHQAAGRLRDHARGGNAHGTCGVGVGETVQHAITFGDDVLRYGDLRAHVIAREKVTRIQRTLRDEISALLTQSIDNNHVLFDEWQILNNDAIVDRWFDQIAPLLHAVPAQTSDAISTQLQRAGTVIFEGAQGVLLDEWRGFHPHTTWSSISTHAVDGVLRDYSVSAKAEHYGVLRAYLTRHGAGPFPTHDPTLDALAEPHNSGANWQGAFRRGHPDAVLLRYALECVGRLDGIALSHLDVFDRVDAVDGLRWCDSYDAPESTTHLPLSASHDLNHQSQLTALLNRATPRYDDAIIKNENEIRERIEQCARLPVCFSSRGNSHLNVTANVSS